jgi:hypothetical protein
LLTPAFVDIMDSPEPRTRPNPNEPTIPVSRGVVYIPVDIPAKTPVDLKTAERIAELVGIALSYQEAGGAKGRGEAYSGADYVKLSISRSRRTSSAAAQQCSDDDVRARRFACTSG